MNYFQLLALPEQYDVDLDALAENYRSLQKAFHPDKFATASEREKLQAVQQTAQVNDGYQTLKDPVKRAEYILSLRGLDLKHEQTTMQDTAFLMEQMELRESLEEIPEADDVEQAIEEFDELISAQTKNYQLLLAEQITEQSDEANHSSANLIRKLKFMLKLHHELEQLEDSILD